MYPHYTKGESVRRKVCIVDLTHFVAVLLCSFIGSCVAGIDGLVGSSACTAHDVAGICII